MPSPFPGMNPYFEDDLIWEDFHQTLTCQIQALLTPQLRPHYFAAIDTEIAYEEIFDERQPEHICSVPVKQFTVEVREVKDKSLVTAIEILSPVNKRRSHHAFEEYQKKRNNLLSADVNLLEIDLLRAGARWPMPEVNLPKSPYFVFLHRAGSRQILIWPLKLQEAIPALPVPLREPDPDVYLDLTAAIQNIYDRAAYDLRIDYREPPPKPEMTEDEAVFCKLISNRSTKLSPTAPP